MPPSSPSSRKRGGQPGNANAMRHGFYSRHMKAGEQSDLENLLRPGVQDETAALRVMIGRLLKIASEENNMDIETAIAVTNALGTAAIKLSSLLRTQKILEGGADATFQQTLSQALSQVLAEIGA